MRRRDEGCGFEPCEENDLSAQGTEKGRPAGYYWVYCDEPGDWYPAYWDADKRELRGERFVIPESQIFDGCHGAHVGPRIEPPQRDGY